MSHVTGSAFVFIKEPRVTCLKDLIREGLVSQIHKNPKFGAKWLKLLFFLVCNTFHTISNPSWLFRL